MKTFSSMAGHHLKPWSELEWELDIVGLRKLSTLSGYSTPAKDIM